MSNYLSFHLKKIEKEESKPKVSKSREIVKRRDQ